MQVVIEADASMEVNGDSKTVYVIVHLERVCMQIRTYSHIFISLVLDIPLLEKKGEKEVTVRSRLVINKSFRVQEIEGKAIKLEIPYLSNINLKEPSKGKATVLGYTLQAV